MIFVHCWVESESFMKLNSILARFRGGPWGKSSEILRFCGIEGMFQNCHFVSKKSLVKSQAITSNVLVQVLLWITTEAMSKMK